MATKKEWKVLSHAERMMNKDLGKTCKEAAKKNYEVSEALADVDIEIGGEVLKVTKTVKCDPRKEFAKYNVNDFKLSNIIRAGALDTLKYNTAAGADIDAALNNMEAHMAAMDAEKE